ncbi:MAG: 30S ribosomal protein S16 [Chloroflexi bacterium]|nr:30S ribosomal protein S16 [Chloroflexota bacterium]MBI3734014.1 30S ribosomal protein S16 [Chloroflexota bacterium]
MSVKIRLRRMGAKKQPTYRVVVADEKKPRNGAFIENIGHYNPRTDPPTVVIDEARALHWLKNGAQPSESVVRLMKRNQTMDKLARVKKGESIEQVMMPPEEPAKP